MGMALQQHGEEEKTETDPEPQMKCCGSKLVELLILGLMNCQELHLLSYELAQLWSNRS